MIRGHSAVFLLAVAAWASGCAAPSAAPVASRGSTMQDLAVGAEAENQVIRASLNRSAESLVNDYRLRGRKWQGVPIVNLDVRAEPVVFVPQAWRPGGAGSNRPDDACTLDRTVYEVRAVETVRGYELRGVSSIERRYAGNPFLGTVRVALVDDVRMSSEYRWEEPAPPPPPGYRLAIEADGVEPDHSAHSLLPVYGSPGAERELILPLPPGPAEPEKELPPPVAALKERAKKECLAAIPVRRQAESLELRFIYSTATGAWRPLAPSTPVRPSVP